MHCSGLSWPALSSALFTTSAAELLQSSLSSTLFGSGSPRPPLPVPRCSAPFIPSFHPLLAKADILPLDAYTSARSRFHSLYSPALPSNRLPRPFSRSFPNRTSLDRLRQPPAPTSPCTFCATPTSLPLIRSPALFALDQLHFLLRHGTPPAGLSHRTLQTSPSPRAFRTPEANLLKACQVSDKPTVSRSKEPYLPSRNSLFARRSPHLSFRPSKSRSSIVVTISIHDGASNN